MFQRFAIAAATLALATAAQADTFTLNFRADGFQAAGSAPAGFSGPITGSVSWQAASQADPIGNLTGIDLAIYGHRYTLAEVGIANQNGSTSVIGALLHGANAVVGDGSGDDFMFGFDRMSAQLSFFAYAINGKSNAIWWTPSSMTASISAVPEPATWASWLGGLAGLALLRRRSAQGLSQVVDTRSVNQI